MAESPPPPSMGMPGIVDEIVAVLAGEGPAGATAMRVARALGLGHDPELVQDTLEELVARGMLDRRGVGHGALYTLGAGV